MEQPDTGHPDMSAEEQKRVAAEAAVALVEPGMVVGLGTGSTAAYAIDALIRRVAAGLDIVAIPDLRAQRRPGKGGRHKADRLRGDTRRWT